MPINEPLKVSISPKAMRSEWWISPTGGVMSPAVSNAHPKAHMAVAIMSCKRFILVIAYLLALRAEILLILFCHAIPPLSTYSVIDYHR